MLTVVTLLRCTFVINLIVVFSHFNGMNMKNICDQHYIEFSYALIIRSLLLSIPYVVTGVILISFLFVFGYTISKFEFPYSKVSGQNWKVLTNGLWNTVITMSTVGYGDLYAVTNFGRLTGILIMFWGAFINSLIIVAMQITASFTPQQQNVSRASHRPSKIFCTFTRTRT